MKRELFAELIMEKDIIEIAETEYYVWERFHNEDDQIQLNLVNKADYDNDIPSSTIELRIPSPLYMLTIRRNS